MIQNDRYIKEGQVINPAQNKRDFAKAVVINKFNEDDIRDMLDTLNINNKADISNEIIRRKSEKNYSATFDMTYQFPTESSALLFKTINHELTNYGKSHNVIDLEQNGTDVTISLGQSNNSGFISSMQNSSTKVTQQNIIERERLLLASELFTSTVSNLMTSDLYNFYQDNERHQLVQRRVTDSESFDKVSNSISENNINSFYKACVKGHMIDHNEDLNNCIVDHIRSVEHVLLQDKQSHSLADITVAKNNFEIGNAIQDLESVQVDIHSRMLPNKKVNNNAMKNIRNDIRDASIDINERDHILPEDIKAETNNILTNFMDSLKSGIRQVKTMTIDGNGEIINKDNARPIEDDSNRHVKKNKYG
jgi:signal recognition particle subunit SEC65